MHGSRSLLVHLIHSVISLPPPLEKKNTNLAIVSKISCYPEKEHAIKA